MSLDAEEREGTVLTEPLTAPARKLFVNVDATEGELRAEVLDKSGEVLARSAPMKGDRLRGEVRWEKGNVGDCKGKVISIRFMLRNAACYSYWFGES